MLLLVLSFSPVYAWDSFLYGEPHSVVLSGADGDMSSAPAVILSNEILVGDLLRQDNRYWQKVSGEFEKLQPGSRILRDKVALGLIESTPAALRRKQLSSYARSLYKADTRKGKSERELLTRRMRELFAAESPDSIRLTAILQAAARFKDWQPEKDEALLFERRLNAAQGKKLGEINYDEVRDGLVRAELIYLDSQLDPGKRQELLKRAKSVYDAEPESLFYSIPFRLELMKIDEEKNEQTLRILDAMRQREKEDRPSSGDFIDSTVREASSALASFDTSKLDEEKRIKLKEILNHLSGAAYLYKIDMRSEEAARLYRRLYQVVSTLPEDKELNAAIAYDLAENAMWNECHDESLYYFDKSAELRKVISSSTALDTRGLMGRVYVNAWENEKGREHFHALMQDLSGLKAVESTERLCTALEARYLGAGVEDRRRIIDAIQGMADCSVNGKYYADARILDQSLLRLRKAADPPDKVSVMHVLWQMAWCEQNALNHKAAAEAYGIMIREYPLEPASTQAMWYQARALCYDLSGDFKLAASDFKKALSYLAAAYRQEKDPTARDNLYWTAADIKYNLKQRHLLAREHYDDGVYTCFFARTRLPLRVYLAAGRKDGFSGSLRASMLDAISQWTDFAGSPLTIRYVDRPEDADIFVERVTSYRDIPLGSAGRSSAIYVQKKGEDTRELSRVHIRVYCESFDGENLSAFAREHLYTLFIHEFGHAIGLPHSPNGLDVMYWKACATRISERDKATVRRIYSVLEKELKAKD